jgi:hypothetical protein
LLLNLNLNLNHNLTIAIPAFATLPVAQIPKKTVDSTGLVE